MKTKTVLLNLLLAGALQGALIYAPGQVEIVNFTLDRSSASEYLTSQQGAFLVAEFWLLNPPANPVAQYPCSPYCGFDVEAFNQSHMTGLPGGAPMQGAPEPSVFALAGLGLLGLGIGRMVKR